MTRALVLSVALPVALSLSLACSSEATPTPEPPASATVAATATATATAAVTAQPTASAAAAEPAKDHWARHRGNSTAWQLLHAAHTLELKDAQKATIDKIADDLHADRGAQAQMKAYHAALAAQVRAGKIELAKLDPLRVAADKALQAHQEKENDALNALFAALEPAQRTAVVAAVRARHDRKAEKIGGTDGWEKKRLAALTKQLDLDAAQQKKAEPLIAKDISPKAMHELMKKQLEAVVTAFGADGFDAKKVATPPPAKSPLALHTDFVAALLPILKPEQREKLAASMEKDGGGRGGTGHDAPGGPANGGDHDGEDDAPKQE